MQCNVLIVDNDPLLALFLKLHFAEIGIETEIAGDGSEALEKIDKFDADIILSEITLPITDGYELRKKLLDNPDTVNIPFIFLTGKKELSDQIKGFRMGINDYVCKPFEINDLIQRIQQAIEHANKFRKFKTEVDFAGNLSQLPWTDILQLIELNIKTGELQFFSLNEDQIGKAIFSDGRLINAEFDHLVGEEAFFSLMMISEGFFEFFSKSIDSSPLIKSNNTSILMQGSQMKEHYRMLIQLLPDLSVNVKLTTDTIPDKIKKTTADPLLRKILSLIDNKHPVQSILQSGVMSRIRAASILLNLIKNGLLEIEDHKIGTIPNDPAPSPDIIDPGLIKILTHIEKRFLTGILEFRNRTLPQAIFFQKGRPVHATYGTLTGEKALFRIFRERGGNLIFNQQAVLLPFSINKSLANLLQEAKKEIRKLQKINNAFLDQHLCVNDHQFHKYCKIKNLSALRNFISLVQENIKVCKIIENSKLTDSKTYDQLKYLLNLGILEMKDKN